MDLVLCPDVFEARGRRGAVLREFRDVFADAHERPDEIAAHEEPVGNAEDRQDPQGEQDHFRDVPVQGGQNHLHPYIHEQQRDDFALAVDHGEHARGEISVSRGVPDHIVVGARPFGVACPYLVEIGRDRIRVPDRNARGVKDIADRLILVDRHDVDIRRARRDLHILDIRRDLRVVLVLGPGLCILTDLVVIDVIQDDIRDHVAVFVVQLPDRIAVLNIAAERGDDADQDRHQNNAEQKLFADSETDGSGCLVFTHGFLPPRPVSSHRTPRRRCSDSACSKGSKGTCPPTADESRRSRQSRCRGR